MTLAQALAVLRQVPLETSVAVGQELALHRPLEAQRRLALALGDGRQAEAVIAAIIRFQLTGHTGAE